LIILLVALALLVSGGCGEEEQKALTPEEAMGYSPDKGSSSGSGTKKKRRKRKKSPQGFKANASWDQLAPHFLKFATRMDDEVHNPALTWKYRDAFQDNLDKLFPPKKPAPPITRPRPEDSVGPTVVERPSGVRSILDALKEAGTQPIEHTDVTEIKAAPEDPLLLYPLTTYRFQIILSGTSNPEVQVETPGGELMVLHVNDRIGLEGGFVQDILKQEVLIKIPEQENPEIVSLMPPILPVEFATP